MSQFARPSSDVAVNSWTTTPLYSQIGESSYSDGDYIQRNAVAYCEVGLSSLSDPASSSGHYVRYRLGRSRTDRTLTIVVRLMQGGTEIASWTHTDPALAFAAFEQTLTTGQADSITNYSDLRLRFDITALQNTQVYGQVSWAELEVPNAGAASLTIEESFHTHKSDDFAVTTQIPLVIEDSLHTHVADNCDAAEPSLYLVDIDLETGDLSEFTGVGIDAGDMSVSSAAALAGTNYGIQFLIDDTTAMYGYYDLASPPTNGIARARFYFDPNGVAMTTDYSSITICTLQNSSSQRIAAIRYRKWPSDKRIDIVVYDNTGTGQTVAATALTDEPHYIEFQILRGSGDSTPDGEGKLWVDGNLVQTVSLVTNGLRFSNLWRSFLTCSDIPAGVSGTIYSDQFIVNNTTDTIGPYGGPTPVNLTIEESFHNHQAEDVPFAGPTALTIEDTQHTLKSDEISLADTLTIGESFHGQAAEDASLAIFIDDIILEWYYLVIEDSLHGHISEELNFSGATNLTIEESFHVQASEEPAITTVIALVVEDCSHSHIVKDVPITKTSTLVIEDSYHGHVAEDVITTKSDTLVTQESRHAQAAEDFILVQLHNLSIEEARHGHVADDFILTQLHVLSIMEAVHAHKSDDVATTKSDTLVIEDSSHIQTAENCDAAPVGVSQLTIGESFHAHTAEHIYQTAHSYPSAIYYIITPEWTDASNLYLEDGNYANVSLSEIDDESKPGLYNFDFDTLIPEGAAIRKVTFYASRLYKTPDGTTIAAIRLSSGASPLGDELWISAIASAPTMHSLTESSVVGYTWEKLAAQGTTGFRMIVDVFLGGTTPATIYMDAVYVDVGYTPATVLTIEDSLHGHQSEEPVLTTQIPLVIEDGLHSHTAEEPLLTKSDTLVIGEALHAHVVEDVLVTKSDTLIVEDSFHSHTAEEAPLTKSNTLVVEDAFHSHIADLLLITKTDTLVVEDTAHLHTSEQPVLGQIHNLVVEDCFHSHVADQPNVLPAGALDIQDSVHGHASEALIFIQVHNLVVEDSLHSLVSEEPNLTGSSSLVIEESFHGHITEDVILSTQYTLSIQDSRHRHYARVCWFSYGTVFSADHEEGDSWPDWKVEWDPDGDLAVTTDAGLAGSIYGLELTLGHSAAYANYDLVPNIETTNWQLRFYLDPNSCSLGNMVRILEIDNETGYAIQVYLSYIAGSYRVTVWYWDVSYPPTSLYSNITDAPHKIEIGLWLGGGSLAIDDGTPQEAVVDNTTLGVILNQIYAGVVLDEGSGNTGTFYLDEFVLNDIVGEIGEAGLVIEDSRHGHTSDQPVLGYYEVFQIQGSFHAHTAESPLLDANELTIGVNYHSHTVGSIAIWSAFLDVQSCWHGHTVDALSLGGTQNLIIYDSQHNHTADLMDPDNLNIQDSRHAQVAEQCSIITAVIHTLTLGIRSGSLHLEDRSEDLTLNERSTDLTLGEL